MKSRLAILGMLVTGILFSTAGAGLAVSGMGGANTNAAISQYATPTATPCVETQGGVSPSEENGSSGGAGGNENCAQQPQGGVLPAEAENAPKPKPAGGFAGGGTAPATESAAGTQPVRQQAAAVETSQLPFTGFAAIPVLIGGLALLTGGLILRRRTRQKE
ncbi:MAG TPA: hypothetical protein VFG79_02705 [Solirubrobacter sp.]|nr:hypothetical protein [Solirubrobacter sp.]